jgi:phosphoribosylformylglycinamidine synthase subunit PurS
MIATIIVTPKKSILDPQGEAVRSAIHSLGMDCVTSARIGKYIELDIKGNNVAQTRAKLESICRDLLSNPVIEDYRLSLEEEASTKAVVKLVKVVSKPKVKVKAKTELKPRSQVFIIPKAAKPKKKKKDKKKKNKKKGH